MSRAGFNGCERGTRSLLEFKRHTQIAQISLVDAVTTKGERPSGLMPRGAGRDPSRHGVFSVDREISEICVCFLCRNEKAGYVSIDLDFQDRSETDGWRTEAEVRNVETPVGA